MERHRIPHRAPVPGAGRRRQRQASALAGLLATAALVSVACSGNHRPVSPPGGQALLPAARGTASWYGPKFAGRPTASGERYDPDGLTAAHPSLPFGTLIQVTNLDNGHQVVVRVNDRGPFAHRRIIDVSYAAARQLAMVGPGTARVELAIVGRGGLDSAPPLVFQTATAVDADAPAGGAGGAVGDAVSGGGAPAGSAATAEGRLAVGGDGFAGSRTGAAATDARSGSRSRGNPADGPGEPGGGMGEPYAGAAPDASAAAAPSAGTARSTAAGATLVPAQPPAPTGAEPTGGAKVQPRRAPSAAAGAVRYTVQVGAFGDAERAAAMQRDLAARYPATAVYEDGIWNRVQIGLFGRREDAEALCRELLALGIDAFVVNQR
jgi:rare lipoprotein A